MLKAKLLHAYFSNSLCNLLGRIANDESIHVYGIDRLVLEHGIAQAIQLGLP